MIDNDFVILIAEDDNGHAFLIERNLKRSCITKKIIRFKDGQEILDFLFRVNSENLWDDDIPYLLLLDIRMPKVDGIEVLRRIKQDKNLQKMPVIMLTTTDDPSAVEECYKIGCSNYITKPLDYDKFRDAIKQMGLFFQIVEIPKLHVCEG